MYPLFRMSIRQQLLFMIVLLLAPVFLMSGYANDKADVILTRQITDAYVELIKQNHILIDGDIDTIRKITTTIIQSPLTQQLATQSNRAILDRVNKYDALNRLLNSYSLGVSGGEAIVYSLFIPDPDSDYFFAPDFTSTNRGVYFIHDQERPDWYDEALTLGGQGYLQVIDNFGSNSQKTLAFIRSVSSVSGGIHPIGVLVATNMNKKIAQSLQSVSIPQGEIYFTNLDDALYVGPNKQLGSPIAMSTIKNDQDYGRDIQSFVQDGFIHVIHTNVLQQHKLIYKIPINSLVEQQGELKKAIRLISAVYMIFCVLIMLYFLRSLINPLQRLVGFFKSYEPGKMMSDTILAKRRDEVGVLVSSVHNMSQRMNVLVHDKYTMEIKHKEAQLQILYEQINPHMLYNTLESIYWKSSLKGDTESAAMIKDLSKLMKIGLSRGRDLIHIQEELEHIRAYMSLQQKRYDYEFKVIWDIQDEVLNCLIPKIILQPLVENAIVHGVQNMGSDGEIIITATLVQEEIYITIEDNGFRTIDLDSVRSLLDDVNPTQTVGYGIRNVQRRIQLHYGTEYGLSFDLRSASNGSMVTLHIPAKYND
jgi:two-component system sensor histidine kinase YesM